MNNVVQLFGRKDSEFGISEHEFIVTAMTNVSVANEKLGQAVKELSNRFDAIENIIASIDDTEARSQLTRRAKRSREAVLRATLRLTHQIERVVCCHGE